MIGDDNSGDFKLQESIQAGREPAVQHGRTNYALRIADKAVKRQNIRDPLALENLIGMTFLRNPTSSALGARYGTLSSSARKPGWITFAPQFENITYTPGSVEFEFNEERDERTRGITHILVRIGRKTGITSATSNEALYALATQGGKSGITSALDGKVWHEIMVPLTEAYSQTFNTDVRSVGTYFRAYNLLWPTASGESSGGSLGVVVGTPATSATHLGHIRIDLRRNQTAVSFSDVNMLDTWVSFHAVRGIGG